MFCSGNTLVKRLACVIILSNLSFPQRLIRTYTLAACIITLWCMYFGLCGLRGDVTFYRFELLVTNSCSHGHRKPLFNLCWAPHWRQGREGYAKYSSGVNPCLPHTWLQWQSDFCFFFLRFVKVENKTQNFSCERWSHSSYSSVRQLSLHTQCLPPRPSVCGFWLSRRVCWQSLKQTPSRSERPRRS